MEEKTPYLQSKAFLWTIVIAFVVLFIAIFFMQKSELTTEFKKITSESRVISTYMYTATEGTLKYASKYGFAVGIILGILLSILYSILFGLSKLLKLNKYKQTTTIIGLIGALLLLWLAIQLVYIESRYSPISIGIILFAGIPLLYATEIILGILLLVLIYLNWQLLMNTVFPAIAKGSKKLATHTTNSYHKIKHISKKTYNKVKK
jgi:hypothetical protein